MFMTINNDLLENGVSAFDLVQFSRDSLNNNA